MRPSPCPLCPTPWCVKHTRSGWAGCGAAPLAGGGLRRRQRAAPCPRPPARSAKPTTQPLMLPTPAAVFLPSAGRSGEEGHVQGAVLQQDAAPQASLRSCRRQLPLTPEASGPPPPSHPTLPSCCLLQTTFEFHYGKHHAAYVNNLNGQIAGKDLESMTIEEASRRIVLLVRMLASAVPPDGTGRVGPTLLRTQHSSGVPPAAPPPKRHGACVATSRGMLRTCRACVRPVLPRRSCSRPGTAASPPPSSTTQRR